MEFRNIFFIVNRFGIIRVFTILSIFNTVFSEKVLLEMHHAKNCTTYCAFFGIIYIKNMYQGRIFAIFFLIRGLLSSPQWNHHCNGVNIRFKRICLFEMPFYSK
jgi:hypothetical protein